MHESAERQPGQPKRGSQDRNMEAAENRLVQKLTGADPDRITLHDDGFCSRGYTVDGGRLVFKFKKRPDASYEAEAQNLGYLGGQDLGVNMQSVACLAPDGSYVGLHGVPGKALETLTLDEASREDIGRQLGRFLRRLHALRPESAPQVSLDSLIQAWQERYTRARPVLSGHFTSGEQVRIERLMMQDMPAALRELGDKRVFSHADLGDGNILIDDTGRVGVIDFSGCAFMDEASDFIDVGDDLLCATMLDAYGADGNLRQKVRLERLIRPIFVLDVYAERGEEAIQKQIERIRKRLEELPA